MDPSDSVELSSEEYSKIRLERELEQIKCANALQRVNLNAGLKDDSNLYEWQAAIRGPSESPYEGGIFELEFNFTKEYPFERPKPTFKTKIYHQIVPQGSYAVFFFISSPFYTKGCEK